MKYTNFDESTFRQSVEKAIEKVRCILHPSEKKEEEEEQIRLAEDDPKHTYEDKYALAEFVTNTSLAAQVDLLKLMGLSEEGLQTILTWTQEQQQQQQQQQQQEQQTNEQPTITLLFQPRDECVFLKEQTVDVIAPPPTTDTSTVEPNPRPKSPPPSFFGVGSSSSSSSTPQPPRPIIQKIKEYHWKVEVSYTIFIYKGDNPNDLESRIDLLTRKSSNVLITSGGQQTTTNTAGGQQQQQHQQLNDSKHTRLSPIAPRTAHPPSRVNVTWLFQQLAVVKEGSNEDQVGRDQVVGQFGIDRSSPSCHTPRRNNQIKAAVEYHQSLVHWMLVVTSFFLNRMEKEILGQHAPVSNNSSSNNNNNNNNNNNMNANSKLEPETQCLMVRIGDKDEQARRRFNGKWVVVKEYLATADRYRVEPVHAEDDLPPSMTVKRSNLQPLGESSTGAAPLLSSINASDIFLPLWPLLKNGAVLTPNVLLQAHKESIQRVIRLQILTVFAPRQLAKLASQAEAMLVLLCTHWLDLIEQYQNAMNYMEHVIQKQVMAAIGQAVDSRQFQSFLKFHLKALLGPKYAPRPFCHPIRRSQNHDVEGVLTIESFDTLSTETASNNNDNNKINSDNNNKANSDPPSVFHNKRKNKSARPIDTMVRHIPGDRCQSIFIPIDATTTVEITGDRYVHGWIQHGFVLSPSYLTDSFRLVARAHQFTSFVMVVGAVEGNDTFVPRAAILLQNRDQILIPLLTKAALIPATTTTTTKESDDVMESLSPEQQAFAKAFRALQIESSVFGICIVQLKPQLERVLGLEPGALVKEIELTQDLLSLFVNYQIPSDLVSYQGNPDASTEEKLKAVKEHVNAVLEVIKEEKEKYTGKHDASENADTSPNVSNEQKEPGEKVSVPIVRDDESPKAVRRIPTTRPAVLPAQNDAGQATTGTTTTTTAPPPPLLPLKMMAIAAAKAAAAEPRQMQNRGRGVNVSVERVQPGTNKTHPMELKSKTRFSSTTMEETSSPSPKTVEDFTLLPEILDVMFQELDRDNSLQSTLIKTRSTWTRLRQPSLLAPLLTGTLDADAVEKETNQALDLLGTISRSGSLALSSSELHIIVSASHCFLNDVMGTVIQENQNPIEKVEQSALIVASTIHGESVADISGNSSLDMKCLASSFPKLVSGEY